MSGTRLNNSIHYQLLWNRLLALVEEQAQVLVRTAFSPVVRACGDVSVGVFDLQGRMLAQAVTGTPGHVNTMAESVKHFIREFPLETMKAKDAYITNDPWMGTGHLNDFVVVTPCFYGGKCVALFCCTSHLMDVGGLGAGTEAIDVHAEGLYIPMLKLLDEGSRQFDAYLDDQGKQPAAGRYRRGYLFAGGVQRRRREAVAGNI